MCGAICCCRQYGHNRTSAQKNFRDLMEVREPSSDLQQKSLETDSRTFVPHCSKCGMCRSHKFFNKLAPLHSQMFRELRRQLTTLYGDGPGKEVLVAGDALIRVSWRFGGRASSSSASSEDPLPDTDDFEGSRFFLIVSCPAVFFLIFSVSSSCCNGVGPTCLLLVAMLSCSRQRPS